ncbi:MAG: hypothetical protein ACO218_09670 [Steroidobacteraceae bacterium]
MATPETYGEATQAQREMVAEVTALFDRYRSTCAVFTSLKQQMQALEGKYQAARDFIAAAAATEGPAQAMFQGLLNQDAVLFAEYQGAVARLIKTEADLAASRAEPTP